MRFKKLIPLALMLFALCVGRMYGQFETASLVGRITDSTGALVVGAKVTVTNVATNVAISRVTDKAGVYLVPALPAGVYRVVANMSGFNDAITENVHLLVGTNQNVNLIMTIGNSETVTVEASQLGLETETSQKQQVVTDEAIEAFPLLNMNYSDLLTLATGVTQDAAGQDLGTSSVVREGSFNINGQRSTYNNFLLDGMDNNAHGTSNQGFSNQVINPSQYSLSQFSIVTTLPAAEYGRSAGGTINVAFKHGSNSIHGMVYESLRNTIANSNGFFRAASNSGASNRTTLVRNQFGGNVGGPIMRDRFFYFIDYEGLRQVRQVVNQANIFKLSDHQLIASPNATANTTAVLNPFTGETYPADRPLPRSVLSPIALAILDSFPLPNNNGAGTTSISSNWSALQRFINSYDKEDARIDAQWTPRMSTFLRLSQSKEHDLDGPILPSPISGGNGYFRTINQQAALGLTRQIGATQLLEARLGASFTKGGKLPYTLGDPRTFGIPGTPTDPAVAGGLVTLGLSGYTGIGRQATNPQWQYPFFLNSKLSYSWLFGHHNFKTGYEFSYLRQTVQDVNPIDGDMEFQSSFTGYTISDFLFGVPNEVDLTTYFVAHIRQGGHSAFIQDDWKILPRLTLNIGVRYEYASHFYEKDGRLTNFDPNTTPYTGQLLRASSSGSAYQKQLIDPDLNDFMPRFGFALSPNQKLVIHGGYGIGYMHYTRSGEVDNLSINGPQVNAAVYNQVPKFFKTANVKTSPTFFSLDQGFPQGMASPANFNLFTSTVKWVPRNFRDPYVQSWYAGFQASVGRNRVVDIAYVGNHGVKLQEVGTYNQRDPALGNDPVTGYFRRPYSNIGDVTETFNGGMSNYNGLQARFEQKSFYGIWLLNAFTWSRDFGNVSDSLTASRGFSGSPQDFYNLHNDYGPLQYDTPIINNTALIWTLPLGRGRMFLRNSGSVVNNVLGGWKITAYNQFHSGPALTPNFTPSGFQQLSNSGGVQYRPFFGVDTSGSITGVPGTSLRQFAVKRLHVPGHPEQAFCDSVYSSPTQAAYNGCVLGFATTNPSPTATSGAGSSADPRGNVPNGLLRGDSYDQLDAGINKTFDLPEGMHLEFRGQFYNVLNKTNFTPPGMTCCSTSFGRITSTYGPGRIGQIQARLMF
ncbi:carboxypeptidase regulatory-like domain-containing protein [Granulicella sp. dw_53]|uniref:TonB-dependent receptor n=1 Tax=Granulicella sp. dw_53 TaxID=2719792 RepID=UPI001BD3E2D7|nr:carboxypeptidase regulatory-like domain-containing protein [Granulicella sp. dw_53]